MGHMYPSNWSQHVVRQIYAHGVWTMADMLYAAQQHRRKMAVHCAEGSYDPVNDQYLAEEALFVCMYWHLDHGIIEPQISNHEHQLTWDRFLTGEGYTDAPTWEGGAKTNPVIGVGWNTGLRFAKGGRMKYLRHEIAHLHYIDS